MTSSMDSHTVRRMIKDWSTRGLMRSGHRPEDIEFAIGAAACMPGFITDDLRATFRGPGVIPRFIRDFNAARSIVPGDCEWRLGGSGSDPVCPSAWVWSWLDGEIQFAEGSPHRAEMDTAEEALALAALRARQRATSRTSAPDINWGTVMAR
jgi:hypothetical protein